MWCLELEYSITFTTLDAHSIFILLSTLDKHLEVRIQARDRQYSRLDKGLGSKVVRQPEGETVRWQGGVARQAKFFQATQPIPTPILDGSGRPADMKDRRNTSRSQEKNVNSFNEELSSSDGTGRLERKLKHVHLKKARVSMLSRLMIEQGDLLVTQLQYKTILKFFLRFERSTLTMKHFLKELGQTWTSKFQDYQILWWSTRKVPAFENWFRKLRTTQIDMLFNKNYDEINHLIPSVQNPNKWFMKWETSNCVNCSRRNPKRSVKYVCHTGTLASSIARWSTSCENEERRIRNSASFRWTIFQFPTTV